VVRRYWWLAPVLLAVSFILWLATGPEWSQPRTGRTSDLALPPGYVGAFQTVQQEFLRFNGHALDSKDLAADFDAATQSMKQHDYSGAAQSLEDVVKQAPVPAVFNNLGLVYVALNDRGHAVNAFREALSRDIEYPQVRQNLDRLKEISLANATPLTQEIEPNNTLQLTNIIATGKLVDGEIMPSVGDVDWYKVTTPGVPRDLLRIELTPKTPKLEPMLRVFDGDKRLLEWAKGKDAPGKPLSWIAAPPPNSTVYLEVSAANDTAGLYQIKVTPLKAFDASEPNDDIYNARAISLGADLDSAIMDRADTDFYSFEARSTGNVRILIRNRSRTLIPALSTFGPDLRTRGFGTQVRTPGANLEHSLAVEAGKKYFLQVWSQANTAGDYTLHVE
jgi:hypothetical protein